MSNKLSRMPNISIPRSRFKQDFNHATSFYHGYLYPIDAVTVIPGDEFKLDLASLVRMSTPIVPFFGNIKMYVGAFFVPFRILLDDFEKFMGDPTNHDKIQSVVPVNPDNVELPYWASFVKTSGVGPSNYEDVVESVAVRLGKPVIRNGVSFTTSTNGAKINVLKEMAYYQIWNDHFRPSNLIEPILLYKNTMNQGVGAIGVDLNGASIGYYARVLQVCKNYDYFTASTLSPQFGSSVTLPLGTFAPVQVYNNTTGTVTTGSGDGYIWTSAPQTISAKSFGDPLTTGDSGSAGVNLPIGVDLSQATAATINTIRWAFQVQKYLERSNYGSKYFEILNAHYGITNPDSRMQRAERLGVHSFFINVNQVLSTAGQAADATQKVGQVGAVSVTGDRSHICNFAFSEPGCFMVLAWTKHDRSYDGGVHRDDLYSKRLDFYSPEFANLGDQATKELEIHAYKTTGATGFAVNSDIFGYQEAWAELRYRRDRISGLLSKSTASQYIQAGLTGTPAIMDYWTLADDFEGAAIGLNKAFLFEDRAALARCLTTGSSGPDYICDFHFNYVKTAELPLYSIPGLIDHFGAL